MNVNSELPYLSAICDGVQSRDYPKSSGIGQLSDGYRDYLTVADSPAMYLAVERLRRE